MSPTPAPLFRLPHLGLIRAEGPEARAFLQGQLSCDLAQVTAARGQLGGYCSPKGRLLAVLTLLPAGPEAFWLVLPQPLVAPTLKRLRMFVLRSKVALTEPADWAVCGHLGPSPDGDATPWRVSDGEQHTWLHRPGAARQLVIAPGTAAATDPAADTAWQQAEIEAGLPIVHPETVDAFVPQTADLDLAGGISFTKGCYPGQEIVARVHYLGRAKQRLFHARADTLPAPGTAVLDAQGQSAGTVMTAVAGPEGGAVLLAVLQLAHTAPLQLEGGTPLQAVARAHADPAA